jgi:hypothetical protein
MTRYRARRSYVGRRRFGADRAAVDPWAGCPLFPPFYEERFRR